MIRRPPRSTPKPSSAASDVYKRQLRDTSKKELMKNRKILYVSSEVVPYLPENEISSMSFEIPKMVNKQGGQIRIFMPKYGNINERRHQLHEVIRLSGLNLVVNDLDMPLIIKVASIPKERIQVYFIDMKNTLTEKLLLKILVINYSMIMMRDVSFLPKVFWKPLKG